MWMVLNIRTPGCIYNKHTIMEIMNHIYMIITTVLSVYEILARVIPTTGNWSLVSKAVVILDKLVKNRIIVETAVETVVKVVEQKDVEVK